MERQASHASTAVLGTSRTPSPVPSTSERSDTTQLVSAKRRLNFLDDEASLSPVDEGSASSSVDEEDDEEYDSIATSVLEALKEADRLDARILVEGTAQDDEDESIHLTSDSDVTLSGKRARGEPCGVPALPSHNTLLGGKEEPCIAGRNQDNCATLCVYCLRSSSSLAITASTLCTRTLDHPRIGRLYHHFIPEPIFRLHRKVTYIESCATCGIPRTAKTLREEGHTFDGTTTTPVYPQSIHAAFWRGKRLSSVEGEGHE